MFKSGFFLFKKHKKKECRENEEAKPKAKHGNKL